MNLCLPTENSPRATYVVKQVTLRSNAPTTNNITPHLHIHSITVTHHPSTPRNHFRMNHNIHPIPIPPNSSAPRISAQPHPTTMSRTLTTLADRRRTLTIPSTLYIT